jgi:hypothetical protein
LPHTRAAPATQSKPLRRKPQGIAGAQAEPCKEQQSRSVAGRAGWTSRIWRLGIRHQRSVDSGAELRAAIAGPVARPDPSLAGTDVMQRGSVSSLGARSSWSRCGWESIAAPPRAPPREWWWRCRRADRCRAPDRAVWSSASWSPDGYLYIVACRIDRSRAHHIVPP